LDIRRKRNGGKKRKGDMLTTKRGREKKKRVAPTGSDPRNVLARKKKGGESFYVQKR